MTRTVSDSLFRSVVLQPTTSCNLNCSYCYLPNRQSFRRMTVPVAAAVARSLDGVDHQIKVLWHGGEPLTCGLPAFRSLVAAFGPYREAGTVRHSLQTNATLITAAWCEFFLEHGFRVGVSIDGPPSHNASRLNWAARPAYPAIMRGIEMLHRYSIPFGVIAVVNPANIDDPHAFYDFFLSIGCTSLNINVAEREGLNRDACDLADDKVSRFWMTLFEAWRARPYLRIREFDDALGWMRAVCGDCAVVASESDMWPTVAFNGDVVVLSPELMATTDAERPRFIVGNVLEASLAEILRRALHAPYVQDFWHGISRCRTSCPYFSCCGGGHASNKYYELGTTDATETKHCRDSVQAVVNAVLTSLSGPTQGLPERSTACRSVQMST